MCSCVRVRACGIARMCSLLSQNFLSSTFCRRLAKFFQSGVMGAALKVSDSNRSAWIVDGGSNGGVMKLAGEARTSMGSVGLNIPLIGIGVAIGTGRVDELYDTVGHSHLILAVDSTGGCPTKVRSDTTTRCPPCAPNLFPSSHSLFLSRAVQQSLTATRLSTPNFSKTLCP